VVCIKFLGKSSIKDMKSHPVGGETVEVGLDDLELPQGIPLVSGLLLEELSHIGIFPNAVVGGELSVEGVGGVGGVVYYPSQGTAVVRHPGGGGPNKLEVFPKSGVVEVAPSLEELLGITQPLFPVRITSLADHLG